MRELTLSGAPSSDVLDFLSKKWGDKAKVERVIGRTKVHLLFHEDYQPLTSTAAVSCLYCEASSRQVYIAVLCGGGRDQIIGLRGRPSRVEQRIFQSIKRFAKKNGYAFSVLD